MSGTRDERIRQRAHKIWEQSGQTEGMAQDHWLEAEKAIDKEDKAAAKASAKAPAKAKVVAKKVAAAPEKKKSAAKTAVKTAKPKAKG